MNITYISSVISNNISCLPVSALSEYILTEEEQQYIETLSKDTESVISSIKLAAAVKAGSSMYTQPVLNDIYARNDDGEFKPTDLVNFKEYLNKHMVGNNIGKIKGLQ